MKKNVSELEKITVTNHGQLLKALEPFMSDTAIRKLLIEGMDMVKRQSELEERYQQLDDKAFGDYKPAIPLRGGHYMWVDTLIKRRLDGKREGFKVVWNLPEGKFAFDPWAKKLERQTDANPE